MQCRAVSSILTGTGAATAADAPNPKTTPRARPRATTARLIRTFINRLSFCLLACSDARWDLARAHARGTPTVDTAAHTRSGRGRLSGQPRPAATCGGVASASVHARRPHVAAPDFA